MIRFLLFDLKRLFAGRALIALAILAPLIVILLFSLVVAPLLMTARGLHFNVALFDDDGSENVQLFIRQLVDSPALSDLVTIVQVASLAEGEELVAGSQVSVLVHIPPRLFERIQAREDVVINLVSRRGHELESSLIAVVLNQSLQFVGSGQNQLDLVRRLLLDQQLEAALVERTMDRMTLQVLAGYMNRREVIGSAGAISPLGDYLPIEYYLIAVYCFFAALTMLPLVYFTSHDLNSSILQRGLLSGLKTARFFLVRLLSGSALVLLALLMLLPVSRLLRLSNDFLGSTYASHLPALLLIALLLSLAFAALAFALASWLRSSSVALWLCFYLILFMAVSGGIFVPPAALPPLLGEIGLYLPLRPGLRSLANALYFFDRTTYWPDFFRLVLLCLFLIAAGYGGLRWREVRS